MPSNRSLSHHPHDDDNEGYGFCLFVILKFCRQDIIEALSEATNRGVIIVTCTQCSSGAVSARFDLDLLNHRPCPNHRQSVKNRKHCILGP